MKKTIAVALVFAALFGLSACVSMDTTTGAPEPKQDDAPKI